MIFQNHRNLNYGIEHARQGMAPGDGNSGVGQIRGLTCLFKGLVLYSENNKQLVMLTKIKKKCENGVVGQETGRLLDKF